MVNDPLAYLFALDQFGIKFGLDNIRAIVAALGHPERTFRALHVAGTNGKGSVTAMTASALVEAGYRTARYTSPHLVDLSERFVIDGTPVDQGSIVDAVDDVRRAIDGMLGNGALLVQPTFFEVTTAVAFELFRRAGVEVAVCEVGLGGRLDATNVLDPVATAITSIAFDHQRYLGDTLGEIANEKAGIIKPHVPVVVGPMAAEALEPILQRAAAVGAPVIRASGDDFRPATSDDRLNGQLGNDVILRTDRDYGPVRLSLPGRHQLINASVAVRLVEAAAQAGITVPAAAVVRGLERVKWPGRLDLRRLPDGREVLLDAAHNPEGAGALAAFLSSCGWQSPPIVFAAMQDKDVAGMLRALAPAVGTIVITRASNQRSAGPAEIQRSLQQVLPGHSSVVAEDLSSALSIAWGISPRIVVAGSIFLLGDVLGKLSHA